ncbi:PAS domain-containing protein [Lysinibacillus fusiformis]|uniref:PAS domain-containing protein n=1 Tax=Lysinibacillus fusiformis TaxID=28031 RepID=UPI00215A7737|nr:PAS domain-containing protein [Lysinibacillus fusiformis]MCR8854885.1 PAS domain-containing protein [Lysinibacillus fusiformis]WKT77132.1 PAS domain-containing protein [Lysinibacillus fusiformis]
MKLRKKIYATFILMIVAGTVSFRSVNEAIGHLPKILGVDPYAIFIGLVYLILTIGIMEYFVLFRISHFNEEIKEIKSNGFVCKRNIYNFTKKDELGEIIEDVNTVLHELNKQTLKLATKNKLYMSLVNDESIFTYRFKPCGTITFANNTFANTFNYHYKDMLGKDIFDFVERSGLNSEELKRSIALLNPSTTSSNLIYDTPRILNEENPKWIAWTISAAFDDRGLIKEYQVVGINMHKVSGLLEKEHGTDNHKSTILLSPEGKIDYMFSSFDFSHVIGEDFMDFIHEKDKKIVAKTINSLLFYRKKSVVNVRVNFKEIFVHMQMAIDYSVGKDDKIRNIVINAIDMTEIHGAQEKVVGAVSDMHKILEKNKY